MPNITTNHAITYTNRTLDNPPQFRLQVQLNLHQWSPLYNGHIFLANSPYID